MRRMPRWWVSRNGIFGSVVCDAIVFAAVVLLMLPCNVKRIFHKGT